MAQESGGPCSDKGKIYKVCQDQGDILARAIKQAKATKGKMVLLTFGANWCPWCVSLDKLFNDKKFMQPFAEKYLPASIALYQKKQKLDSAVKIIEHIKKVNKSSFAVKGVPFLVVLNPRTDKAVFLDTEKLEKNTKTSKGHDQQKVAQALEEAYSQVQ